MPSTGRTNPIHEKDESLLTVAENILTTPESRIITNDAAVPRGVDHPRATAILSEHEESEGFSPLSNESMTTSLFQLSIQSIKRKKRAEKPKHKTEQGSTPETDRFGPFPLTLASKTTLKSMLDIPDGQDLKKKWFRGNKT